MTVFEVRCSIMCVNVFSDEKFGSGEKVVYARVVSRWCDLLIGISCKTDR